MMLILTTEVEGATLASRYEKNTVLATTNIINKQIYEPDTLYVVSNRENQKLQTFRQRMGMWRMNVVDILYAYIFMDVGSPKEIAVDHHFGKRRFRKSVKCAYQIVLVLREVNQHRFPPKRYDLAKLKEETKLNLVNPKYIVLKIKTCTIKIDEFWPKQDLLRKECQQSDLTITLGSSIFPQQQYPPFINITSLLYIFYNSNIHPIDKVEGHNNEIEVTSPMFNDTIYSLQYLFRVIHIKSTSSVVSDGQRKREKRGKSSKKSIHAIVFDNRLIGCSLHPYSTLSPLIL
ncbi:hypothetical protein WN51_11188 [Melipona quadrifasciata]|uniref:Uncharacterized protein n=1 Tax=Melipona quadrifasciata TaxID=166423 RepID=A0A0N0BI10_9HYME|nr:hypothetical protein WN51_11188 [Melipona quadrifasciata]